MRGFTLIEVLIVVAIGALLAAILVPAFTGTHVTGYGLYCTNGEQKVHWKALDSRPQIYDNGTIRLKINDQSSVYTPRPGELCSVQTEISEPVEKK